MKYSEKEAKLLVAQRRFQRLQAKQERIYQDLLLALGETDEPHLWIWDFIANSDANTPVSKVIDHLGR